MTGFELLGRLRAPPPVVFTTAYDRYAVKAFEVSSIDYLLKPVEKPRLAATLDKLERLRGGPARPDLRAVIEEVAAALRTGPAFPDRIASQSGERVQLVELARVTHFFARDKLTFAASAGKDYVVDATIAELEGRLDPRSFVRIHRATLLNLAWVQEVHAWFGGRLMVRLKDDRHTELEVARDRARAFKERLAL